MEEGAAVLVSERESFGELVMREWFEGGGVAGLSGFEEIVIFNLNLWFRVWGIDLHVHGGRVLGRGFWNAQKERVST